MKEKRWLAAAVAGILLIAAFATPAPARAAGPGNGAAPSPGPGNDATAFAAAEYSAPAPAFADRFGACDPHLMFHGDATRETLMSGMESARLPWVRMVFAWSDLEPSEGTFEFARSDRAVAGAREHGVKILGILGTTPRWANGQLYPFYPPPPERMAQWRNYVRTVCSRYRDEVYAWEIWNEENITAFWMPAPDPAAYVELVKDTTPQIRAADPEATVVMGGVAGLDYDYQHTCLDLGIADHVDAMAYHPYSWTLRHGVPGPLEQLTADIVAQERALIAAHTGRPLEIWLTELGWTTYSGESGFLPPPVDPQTQADYLLRSFINYAATEVDRVMVHCLWDERQDPADPECNYGLISNDLTRKKSYYYLSTFQSVIGRAVYAAPGAATFTCSRPDTLRAHSFTLDDGSLAVAAWKSDDQADTLALSLTSASFMLPRKVDLRTGTESSVPGAAFDSEGKPRVTGLAVGKTPVILRFAPVQREWYLAEGTTDWGFDTYLSVMNPNPVPVTADVTYMTDSGAVRGPTVALPAMSQATVFPRDTLGSRDFSTRVTCRHHASIAVDRTVTWTGRGAASPESHSSVGVASASRTWYLPEGSSAWGFETWLLVQNPNPGAASCAVTYMIEGEGPRTVVKEVPANSRRSFSMADDIGARDASIEVASDLAVIAERAMYRNHRRGGHDSIGLTAPAREFFLAEGTTAHGFTTYVLVQNPDQSEATVTLTCMTGDGPVSRPPFRMPGRSRRTVRLNDVLPDRDLSVLVQSTRSVVAERAMYWDAGTGEACHDSVGVPAPHNSFYLPDGQTSDGRETWTLVQNPNPRDVTVQVSYLTPSGSGNPVFTAVVPANSRRTFRMADMLESGRAAVLVTCRTAGSKIVAERAMYWSGRGAGTCSVGAFSD